MGFVKYHLTDYQSVAQIIATPPYLKHPPSISNTRTGQGSVHFGC